MTDEPRIGYHWIIYSKRKNAIWQRQFFDRKEAQDELDRQKKMLTPELRQEVDWEILQRTHRIDTKKKDEDVDWKAFK